MRVLVINPFLSLENFFDEDVRYEVDCHLENIRKKSEASQSYVHTS
jgi:hypothetical protein